jgi:hypothetical protein
MKINELDERIKKLTNEYYMIEKLNKKYENEYK